VSSCVVRNGWLGLNHDKEKQRKVLYFAMVSLLCLCQNSYFFIVLKSANVKIYRCDHELELQFYSFFPLTTHCLLS